MNKTILRFVLGALCALALADAACAQQAITTNVNEWVTDRLKELARDDIKARITQRNASKQSEAPSASSNTTSLVDRTSASDIVGIALDLAGLNTNSSTMNSSSMSATVSAYVFKAAAAKRDPLDPAFYNANRDWRRFSFTIGFDYPEDKVGDVNERAILFGVKYLPYDKRDASDTSNNDDINEISGALGNANVQAQRIVESVKEYVRDVLKKAGFPNTEGIPGANLYFAPGTWGATYERLLTDADRAKLDEIIKSQVTPFVTLAEKTSALTDKIHKRPQIALTYLTKQRKENRPDEHSLGAVFDLGFAPRFTFTLNANFDYVDNKFTKDTKGGSAAAELQVQLTRDKLEGRMPIFLSFSGDGSWMTDVTPSYRAQAKVSIPLLPGVEIPLSVTYASRTEFIKEADVRGKFGFTFDVARIAQAFSGGLLGVKK